jgi:hypothetical protein
MRYSSNQTITAVLLAFGLWSLVSGLSGKAGLVFSGKTLPQSRKTCPKVSDLHCGT